MIREDAQSDLVMSRSACLSRPVAGDEVYGRSSGLRAARNATSGATGRPAWVRTPKPAASSAWPPPQRPPHVNSATPGHDGGDHIKPAPDSTTSQRPPPAAICDLKLAQV
jgi:hypothetical protein